MGWLRGRGRDDGPGGDGSGGSGDPVADFWGWWRAEGADRLAAAFDRGTVDGVQEAVAPRIEAIAPGLAWEFGAGVGSRHDLTVTAAGDPDLRPVARRWLAAAPDPDATWSFHDLRQPGDPGGALDILGTRIAFPDVRVATEPRGTGLDVVVHHPAMSGLPEDGRLQVAYLALDTALGEELTELWVGTVDAAVEEPAGARPLSELPSMLAAVVAERMPDGEMGWTLLQGETPDGPLIALARNRLSSVQAPALAEVVVLEVGYAERTDRGLPAPSSLDALRALEERGETALGKDGMLLGHQSCAGTRTLFWAVRPDSGAADRLREAAGTWSEGPVAVDVRDDPGWQSVAHLRS